MSYLDGDLTPPHAHSVREHLAQCAACRENSENIRRTSSQLASWTVAARNVSLPNGPLQIGVPDRSEKNYVYPLSVPLRFRLFFAKPRIWATAAVLLLGVLGIVVFPRRESHPQMAFNGASAMPSRGPRSEPETLRHSVDESMVSPFRPMIARTASLLISARNFADAHNSLERIVAEHQGYLANLKVSASDQGTRSLDAQARVPSEQLQTVLSELRVIGRVEAETQGGEDVSARSIDLQTRIKNAREEEGRLQEILQKRTGKLSDVLEVEREESRVRGEIEQMEAEQKALSTRVVFAEISLTISEEYHASLNNPLSIRRQLRNAMIDGFRTAGQGLLSISVALLNAGPTVLVLISVLFWPVRWGWRRFAAQSSRPVPESRVPSS